MKAFKYTARSEAGTQLDGLIEANTRDDAIRQLRESGLIVSSIDEAGGDSEINLGLGARRTKDKALAIMCNQFSIILQAGMPIVKALELVSSQTEDKTLKAVLADVADDVAAGYSLADSFAKHGQGLPSTFVETVRAGETSGSLDTVFRRLSDYYEKTSKTKSKVRSAMIYPAFVIVVAVAVIAIIMVVAIPTFTSTFQSMNIELPWVTQFLINCSQFWSRYILVAVAVVIVLVLLLQVAKRNESFRLRWSKLGTRIPILGRINRMNAASQYASTMSVMMEAGLSVHNSVGVTARSMSNHWMGSQLASTQPDLEAGRTLASCLSKTEVFPDLVVEMTGVGEQTGSLENTLRVLAQYYDNEVETASARALSILEPSIIVILAVVVVFILLAVYMPIFSLYGGFGAL